MTYKKFKIPVTFTGIVKGKKRKHGPNSERNYVNQLAAMVISMEGPQLKFTIDIDSAARVFHSENDFQISCKGRVLFCETKRVSENMADKFYVYSEAWILNLLSSTQYLAACEHVAARNPYYVLIFHTNLKEKNTLKKVSLYRVKLTKDKLGLNQITIPGNGMSGAASFFRGFFK